MFTTMKTTYIIPTLMATELAQCLPIANSDPNVNMGQGKKDAGSFEVKGQGNNRGDYDVWSDDWSK